MMGHPLIVFMARVSRNASCHRPIVHHVLKAKCLSECWGQEVRVEGVPGSKIGYGGYCIYMLKT